MDYIGLRALQHERLELKPNNCPHIVTIRSRSFITGNSKIVKLSEVVKLVKDHNAEIDTILVNACRGENDSILTLMKAALRGV